MEKDATKMTAAVSALVEMLSPFSSDDRSKVISASLTILGEGQVKNSDMSGHLSGIDYGAGLNTRARQWIQQNAIDMPTIQQVVHMEGPMEIIASATGKNLKEQTLNAYTLQGVLALLATGETSFQDKDARALCKHLGCYNEANHSVYLKGMGNEFAGTKDAGWKLTAPGMKKAAELIKSIVANA